MNTHVDTHIYTSEDQLNLAPEKLIAQTDFRK